ncbi:MAG TPA: hypothetical protein VNA89_16485, partial [Gemmatimonadaceae bacterium]|nr:hypothetical protein [Gemmatimonadaceae bacterium]
TYVATVRGDAEGAARAARRGVELEDGFVRPADVQARHVGRGAWELELTIAEGKHREVRRLCEALGLTVDRLLRTRFGPVRLGSLPPRATRPLTSAERRLIEALSAGAPMPESGATHPRPRAPRGEGAAGRSGGDAGRRPAR